MDLYQMTNTTDVSTVETTTDSSCSSIPTYFGYIATGIAVLFYGSTFAPVKKFETGNGMFFQWVLCGAIWISGLVVNLIREEPTFYPIVMVGGVVWATGNVCVVPIIKTVGLSLGMCIWSATALLSGWSTGRYGFFGVKPESVDNASLNYIGVTLAVCSAFFFSFVRNDIGSNNTDITISVTENSPLIRDYSHLSESGSTSIYTSDSRPETVVFSRRRGSSSVNRDLAARGADSFFDNLSTSTKRIFGIFLSLASGLLYGQIFTPTLYVQDNTSGASQCGLDYVFSTYCGIYLASTFYFLVYCIFMKNKPKVYPKAILPGTVSGLMWGIATVFWFVANETLSEPVAFPIISTVPAVIASLWGLFVFKEIKGRRNLLILLLGFSFTITGAVLTGLSKKISN
ncbi:hypothetical protein CHS0354_026296 [Potamilus streckersoni]|uniref:Transmembrane protein 144 n=1 Tax=Potamilus streckersoni TaxID=2493646 RepID=A0AAE0TC70_9BIVA|nr:hypothetical protein CHS0354_026296 [Potamilus streckersoni]